MLHFHLFQYFGVPIKYTLQCSEDFTQFLVSNDSYFSTWSDLSVITKVKLHVSAACIASTAVTLIGL